MSDESKPHRSFWSLFTEPQEERSKGPSVFKLFADDSPPPPDEPNHCALSFDERAVFWAMRNIPVEEAAKHFLICGATGSGKSLGIQLFLQSIAPRFQGATATPEQLIIFDAKCDVVPMLAALGLHPDNDNFYILNPFDSRSAVWNLSESVQSPAMARAFATLMVPVEKNSNAPYFSDAARELVYAALTALNQIAPADWSFRDLLCALNSREQLLAVTSRHPPAASVARRVLDDDKHSSGVLSTLATKVSRFEQVAALWHTSTGGRRFSVTEFLRKPGVLVLGNDPVLRESFWPLNAVLLKALTQEILRGPNTLQPRHWMVLDEFRAMERVDCIHDLLNRGRSKGASVLLGIQSIEGLVEIYGEHGAEDILSQCANKTFLRAGGPKTAEWAERFFNKVRRVEKSVTHTSGTYSSSTAVQHSLQERSMFLASYFLDLPFPGREQPYVAVCDVPCLRETVIVRRSFDQVLSWCGKNGQGEPTLLWLGDVQNFPALATKLKTAETGAVAVVRRGLSDQAREALSLWPGTGEVPAALKLIIVQELNRLIEGGLVCQPKEHPDLGLRFQTLQLLMRCSNVQELARLNRLLLEDIFHKELSGHREETVPEVEPRANLDDQTMWPWTKEEEERFCGPPPKPRTEDADKPPTPATPRKETRLPSRYEFDK